MILTQDDIAYTCYFRIFSLKGGSAMGGSFNDFLSWMDRFASAVKIVVPAIRNVAAIFASTESVVDLIEDDQ